MPAARNFSICKRWIGIAELLAAFDIPRAMLPEVRSSSEIYGEAALQRNQKACQSQEFWAISKRRWLGKLVSNPAK